jgi:ribosomal protein S18 acetylase RimI-like enzyme
MPSPFSVRTIDLATARLGPLDPASCVTLAEAIVAIPPWSVMRYPADGMARFLASSADGAYRFLVEADGRQAGAVSVRHPWLKGPYLELLALLPQFQSRGIGAEILRWFEQEGARAEARNFWVCASAFNERALSFYRRHGFKQAASLPGLVADGYTEILLRKFSP